MVAQNLSRALEKQAVKLAAWRPFEVAEALLAELSGVSLLDSRIWQLTQQAGQKLEQACQQQVTQQFETTAAPLDRGVGPQRLEWGRRGVGMDGVMIDIRGEGYKETKLGGLFEIETTPKAEKGSASTTNLHYKGYQNLLARRAGIEATLSQAVPVFELRRTRYFGLAKTHLQHLVSAVGLNLVRLVAWWDGHEPATKPESRLSQLKPAA